MTTRVPAALTTGVVKETDKSPTVGFTSSANAGKVVQLDSDGEMPETYIPYSAILKIAESASDPSNPAEGKAVIWMSDGTGSGDDGDILIKITAGGVTKTATLVDFSAA